ncbi:MAG TPA: DUF2269 domain-containing protein [Burkholderiales bacterium]|nr:DUF2269 domain-containing protein [Burkholderiales bacterium]
MEYLIVKWLHILSSTLLFGTGLGSAFYMYFTNRTRNVEAMAIVTRKVVAADFLFTTPTAILQPLTGFWLVQLAGFPLTAPWILWSVVLYVIAGACWLPVVWIQLRMAKLAEAAAAARQPVSAEYWRLHAVWVLLGVPAFIAFIGIFYLMVVKAPPF